MWTRKYTPRGISEVVGQEKAVEQIIKWYKNWKPGKKALLFHGPPGVGKTCLVEALAKEENLDIIELNASSYRTSDQIKEVLGRSMNQMSLFKKGKLFLIDEIDGVTGREDRGGVGEINRMIKDSSYPIVLTANSPWDPRLRSLHNYVQLVQFGKVSYFDVVKRLEAICKNENLLCEKDILKQIAKRAEGDLRSAINDLEMLARDKRSIQLKDLESLGQRERETSVFDVLKIIFKTKTAISAKLSLQNTDKDPEEIFWWIEQNILNEYEKSEEIAKAYEMLSKADLFNNRRKIRQEHKFLKYMIDMMTAGVALSKKEMYRKFSRYQYPDKIKSLSMSKDSRAENKEKLLEFSMQLHCSTRKIKSEFLPYIKVFAR